MPDLLRLAEQHQAALHRLDDDATTAATAGLADRLDSLQQQTLQSWLAEFGTVRAQPTPQQLATFTAPLETQIRVAYQQSMDEAVAAARASVDQARRTAVEQARQTVNQTPPAAGQSHAARDAAMAGLLLLLLAGDDHHLPGLPNLDLLFGRRKTRLARQVRAAMEEERDAAARILQLLTSRAGHHHLGAGRRLVGTPPGGLSATLLRVVDVGSFSGVQEAFGRARRGITRIQDLMSHEIIDVSGVIVEAVAARLGLGLIWVAEFDDHACLTCLALSGEIVAANGDFPADLSWDRPIPYLGRLRRPPRHIRCRCHTMLVMVNQPLTAALARGLQERARLIAAKRVA